MGYSKPPVALETALALNWRTLSYGRPDDSDRCVSAPQWVVSGDAPNGRAGRITMRPGFHVSAYDIRARTVTEADSRSEPCLALVIVLAGGCEGRVAGNRNISGLRYEAGRCYLSYVSAQARGSVAMSAGGTLQLVDLRLSPAFLRTLEATPFLSGLTPAHPLHLLKEESLWLGAADASQDMMSAAATVFAQAFSADKADIRVERAALSLLDEGFRLFAAETGFPRDSGLSRRAHRRAQQIRALMAADLSRKWTLKDLARAAGISERGLSNLFRAAFDLPVYACLQRMRLERARTLIESGRYSITSASMTVGYDSPSHFAALFKREFGMAPSAVKGVAASAE